MRRIFDAIFYFFASLPIVGQFVRWASGERFRGSSPGHGDWGGRLLATTSRLFLVFLFVGIMVLGYWFFRELKNKQSIGQREADAVSQSERIWGKNNVEFNKSVSRKSFAGLLGLLDVFEDDAGQTVLERIERFKRPFSIIKMFSDCKSQELRQAADLHALKLRSALALIYFENEMFEQKAHDALVLVLDRYPEEKKKELAVGNGELGQHSALARIIVDTVEFVELGGLNREQKKQDLTAKFSALAAHTIENEWVARTIFRLVEIAGNRLETNQGISSDFDFTKILSESYATSELESVRKMAAIAHDQMVEKALTIRLTPEEKSMDKEDLVERFANKLDRVLDELEMSQNDYEVILSRLNKMAASGFIAATGRMLEKVSRYLVDSGESHSDISKEIDQLACRLDWFGREFSIEGIETFDDEPASFHVDKPIATLLLFTSRSDAESGSIRRITDFVRVSDVLNRTSQINFSLIYVHRNGDKSGFHEISILSDKLESAAFWQLDLESSRGKQFSNGLSKSSMPFLIVLDRDKKVVGLDPPTLVLESLIFELQEVSLSNESK